MGIAVLMTDDTDMITDGFWVFGYGSLLWQPEFDAKEQVSGVLRGYHRSFCMWSIHHRGSEQEPGLVLALDKGTETCNCQGVAFFIGGDDAEQALIDLRARELISSAYYEAVETIELTDGRRVSALCYIIDPEHVQYCNLTLEKQAQVISQAVGDRGPNVDYLVNTKKQLDHLELGDADMDWLTHRVLALREDA
jgi:cation transport protein ChaC